MLYEIIIKHVGDNSEPLVLMDVSTTAEAHRFMKLFCGKGWTMDRRPDLHTFPSNEAKLLAITFRRKREWKS